LTNHLIHPPRGVLFVNVRQAADLPAGDWLTGATSAYAELAVAGQRRRTPVAAAGRRPAWCATFEFFNTQLHDTLVVKVRVCGSGVCACMCILCVDLAHCIALRIIRCWFGLAAGRQQAGGAKIRRQPALIPPS
jgi:hypothetical protein